MFRPYNRNDVVFEYYTDYAVESTKKIIHNSRDMQKVTVPGGYEAKKQTFVYIQFMDILMRLLTNLTRWKYSKKNMESDSCNFLVLNWYYAAVGNYWNIRKRTPEVSWWTFVLSYGAQLIYWVIIFSDRFCSL